MFRNLYKQANDEIKGDRSILDKAFLQAAQPVKKTNPILKYSFVGTAALAAIVLGAVFATPSVFMNKTEELTPFDASVIMPTEEIKQQYESDNKLVIRNIEENVSAQNEEQIDNSVNNQIVLDDNTDSKPAQKTTVNEIAETKVSVNTTTDKPKQFTSVGDVEAITTEKTVDEPAVVSEEIQPEKAFEVYDGKNEIAVVTHDEDEAGEQTEISTFSIEREVHTDAVEDKSLETSNEEVESELTLQETPQNTGGSERKDTESYPEDGIDNFSYMYDISMHKEGMEGVKTESFVNTEVDHVTNSAEAIERAKAECTVEYDTITVYHDSAENMWKVMFSKEGQVGGNQDVYIDANGITQLIIYGE